MLVIKGYPNLDLNSRRLIEPEGRDESVGSMLQRL